MDTLFERYYSKLNSTSMDFVRPAIHWLEQDARLIGIKGPRGVGKTTLLLQYLKSKPELLKQSLYVSLDNIWFANNSLYDLADQFSKKGGKLLALDEVHKYSNWSQELKNIYDDLPDLKVIFTGSSLLEILNARADLSRRAVVYTMQGLSYREYLELEKGFKWPSYSLNELLENHLEISSQIVQQIKPLQYFRDYLKHGYYPFFRESQVLYQIKLEEVINMIMEIELPLLRSVDIVYSAKMKQLLVILAESVPFVPNMSKLSERMGISRKTLLMYVHYLQEAGLIRNVYKDATGITQLQKPDKILLDNTNISFMLSATLNEGTMRETFIVNQLSHLHEVEYAEKGDFVVDHTILLEVGGVDKKSYQIKDQQNAYLALDNFEIGNGTRIPLWLFGFLY